MTSDDPLPRNAQKTHNINHLVVFSTLVWNKVVLECLSVFSNVTALRCLKVAGHTVVEGEERGRCANFSTHVANRSHTRARERLDSRTVILDNCAGTTLDRENASNFEDNI